MLKAAAAGLSNLTFTGFVDNVGDYLAAFDIFILPSNREGIGSILLDAMEQGLPVVASRVGGVPDIVHDGENGLLIDPANPAQLRDAILRCGATPRLRRAVWRARPRVREGFHGGSDVAQVSRALRIAARPARRELAAASMARQIKALCITEDPDRPTTATFVGLKNAGVDVTVDLPGGRAARLARSRTASASSTCRCASRFDREAVRRLRAELEQGATTSCICSATRRCRTVSPRAAACP